MYPHQYEYLYVNVRFECRLAYLYERNMYQYILQYQCVQIWLLLKGPSKKFSY